MNQINQTDNQVLLIAGILNATGKLLYWRVDNISLEVGDYAVVENMSGHDLVKVAGIICTEKKLVRKFSNVEYESMKKAIKKVDIFEDGEMASIEN